VSYDLYLWAHADGDVDDVLDALADGDPTPVRRDPRVSAFVTALVQRWPDLADVLETGPDGVGSPAFALLTLPFAWTDRADGITELAAAHGLQGWDPQTDQPLGGGRDRGRSGRMRPGVDGGWTVDDLLDLGLSRRRLTAAWALAALPTPATFGEATAAFILAQAMADGNQPTVTEARDVVSEVATLCAQGIPRHPAMIHVGYSSIDIGVARAVAQGS
jgi:hypothetical protein